MSDVTDLEARVASLEAHGRALEARIRELEDQRGIQDLLSRYMYMADTYNDAGFVNLYTDDGSIKLSLPEKVRDTLGNGEEFMVWSGKDGLWDFITSPQGHHRPDLINKSIHPNLNTVIHIDGDDAIANSYQFELITDGEDITVMSGGNNQWQLRRVDGAWRIKERRGTRLGDDHFKTNMDATPE